MGCVQSLFNSSKSRSPSPEKGFELPSFETMPVTRQPKKSYNTSVVDDRVHSVVEVDDDDDDDDDEDDDIGCNDFDSYAMEADGDLHSLHFVEATACTTLAANSGTVAILGTTAKCKSADASPANRQRPQLVGSTSQPALESRFVKGTAVRKLAADTGTIAVLSSTTEPGTEPQRSWSPEGRARIGGRAAGALSLDAGPPPPSPSPFSVPPSNRWPLQWPAVGGNAKTNESLDRIPVGVIEVLDCEPADQYRPAPAKARRLPRSQRTGRGQQNIPLPVIHAMELKPNALGHDDRFRTVTVQPPSSDRHGYRPRMTAGSSTFDSASRKPFVRQSNDAEDDYAAITGWMANMPVFAKCPPAKSKRKQVPDAGSVVRAAGHRAPRVPDEKHPGPRPALLGVRGPADERRHPGGRAQGVRPGRAREVHQRAAGHGFPGADDGLEGLAATEGPPADRVLGPDGAGPDGAGPGGRHAPGKEHNRTAHAAVVHRHRPRQHAVRSHNHVERGGPVSRLCGGGGGTGTETRTPRHWAQCFCRCYSFFKPRASRRVTLRRFFYRTTMEATARIRVTARPRQIRFAIRFTWLIRRRRHLNRRRCCINIIQNTINILPRAAFLNTVQHASRCPTRTVIFQVS